MDKFAVGKKTDGTDEILKKQAQKNRQSEDPHIRRMQDICDVFGPKTEDGDSHFVILPEEEFGSVVETRDITPNPKLVKILRKGKQHGN